MLPRHPRTGRALHDVIGDRIGSAQYRNVITSKTRLVAYLEGALAYAREGKSFRLESVKKEEDARAAAGAGLLRPAMRAFSSG